MGVTTQLQAGNGSSGQVALNLHFTQNACRGILSVMVFYEKVIKVKADVAAYLINCFPSA